MNTREELAGGGLAHSPPEAGGRGERKGANSASETASPTKTGSQFLTKDFLRFWMVDIHQEGRGWRPAPQNRHKAHPTGGCRNRGWDHGGDKAHCTRTSALVKLLAA